VVVTNYKALAVRCSCAKCLSALPINSSYTVHANAELNAFLLILNPNPSKKLLSPSSCSIILVALTIFPYFLGINCRRVLTASKGLVMLVANPAASAPLVKLMPAPDIVVELGKEVLSCFFTHS